MDLNEPYLAANINNYKQGTRDYLTTLSIPEEEAPKPPIAEEESFYINNSVPDVNDTKPSYLAMSPKSGTVKYNRPDSPTIAKNLDTSPKNKKNVNKKPELPEEIPMLMHNQNGVTTQEYSDEEPHNSYTEMSFNGSKEKGMDQQEGPEYKNVFAMDNENYINVPVVNKSITNPAYTSVKLNTVNERR